MNHTMVDVHEQAVLGGDAVGRSDWEQAAIHVVRGALCLALRDRLAAAQPAAWETALDLLDSDDPLRHQRGLILLLRVIATTPNTGCTVAQRLLAERACSMPHHIRI